MTPKFDNYINTLLENEHEKEGMSTAKKAALGVGAAAALGGLGYLAGKKLGGNVGGNIGGKIGQLKGQVAGTSKDVLVNPGKQLKYGLDQKKVAAARLAAQMDHAARKKIPGVPIKRSYPAILGAVKPDYKEFYKKLGDAGLKSGTETGQTLGTGLGAVAGGTAGATAGAVGAHLATKDKKEKSDK